MIAKSYIKLISKLPVRFQTIKKYNFSSYHLFVILFDLKKSKKNYKTIFNTFRKNNFFVNLHYMPLHLNYYFSRRGFKKKQFPNAEFYGKSALSIPIYPDLKKNSILKVTKIIKSFF